jgi:hypothetical protein
MAANRKIFLRPSEAMQYEEGRAGAAGLMPGMNVVQNSAGEWVAGAGPSLHILREDTLQGRTVDDPYEDEDVLFMGTPKPGDRINGLLLNGENVVIGDKVFYAASGKLEKVAAEVNDGSWFTVREALDLSGVGGTDQLVAVEKD